MYCRIGRSNKIDFGNTIVRNSLVYVCSLALKNAIIANVPNVVAAGLSITGERPEIVRANSANIRRSMRCANC